MAEDRNEDERRAETDRGQQRERDGARVDRLRRRQIVSSEFKVQEEIEAPIARNDDSLRQSCSRCRGGGGGGGGVAEEGFVLVDVVIGVVVRRPIQQAAASYWVSQ